MISDFIKGITTYFEAMAFIRKHNLVRYFFYSGMIGLVALLLLTGIIYTSYDVLSSWFLSWIPWEIGTVTDVLSVVMMSAAFFVIFKYLVLILTAPLMSFLSEKVEQIVSEDFEERGISLTIILGDFWRGIRISLRNVVRELFFTALLLLASIIVPFTVITTPVLYLLQSYFAGFGNFDFWAERHYTYRGTIDFMKDHRPMVTGNGVPYVFMLAIPVLGVFLAPPLATVAATLQGSRKRLSYEAL